MNPREAPKVVIEGRAMEMQQQNRSSSSGGQQRGFRRVFLRGDRHSGEGEVIACSVEELSMDHYKTEGYSEGLHAEGRMLV